MLKQIKYTYITKDKSTSGIVTSLSHALKSLDILLGEYKVIDNIEMGVRIYPESVQPFAIRCSEDEVLQLVKQFIDDGIELILLNGFNIDLDEIRKTYAPLVDEYDFMLCINKLYDVEENISITIDPAIHEMDDEEWKKVKKEIEEDMEDVMMEFELDDEESMDFLKKIVPISALKSKKTPGVENIFEDLFTFKSKEKDEELDGMEPDVIYSQVLSDKELHITKTVDGCIVIDNEIDMITIDKDQIDFFINTISQLLK